MTQFALSVDARRAGMAALVLAGMAAAVVGLATRGAKPPLVLRVVEGHPSRLLEVGPAQRWVVAQQRRGDVLAPYLFRDGGDDDGARIDGIEARSADGRWLAVARGGALTAIDVDTGDERAMSGAERGRGGLRAKFDQAAARLVYFRGATLVVRQLDTGAEATFDVGRDVADFEIHDGPWIALRDARTAANAWLDTTSGTIVDASPSTRP